jgi:DNA-binding NtrC family response regulator
MSNVLLIEDEAVLAKNVQRMLQKLGHTVTMATTAAQGEQRFVELSPDLILLDLRLPDGSGLDLLPRLMAHDPDAQVLMMTAYATVEDAVRAIKLGAKDYVEKPLNMDDLRHAVTRVLEEQRLHQEVSYYRSRESHGAGISALQGTCTPMVELRAKIQRLSTLPATAAPPTVLITGETGTGKGLVARVLHYSGPRAGGPFIEVNCGAIPENLVEAELFGYQRGAFTDAKTSKPGLFQAADRGTLFLDEVGCLPLPVQVKILRAIEEKTVRQVGGRSEQSVDTQILAATNSDLDTLVRQGMFREDLFYRLRVAPLSLPPLRERGTDVLLLARMFVADLSAKYRLPPKVLSEDAERAISCHRWPGNIRELRNTLDRAVLFTDGETISASALGLPISVPASLPLHSERAGLLEIDIPDGGIRFEEVERAIIIGGLRKARGSQSDAARLLGLTRDTLRYRMEKFGITPKDTQ